MIVIEDYNPQWPLEFEKLARDLKTLLGPLALRIDHIGSTAVPDLAAKDIIDVQVTVASLSPEIPARLTAAGYIWRHDITQDHVPAGADPAPAHWTKLYFKTQPPARMAHIHVRVLGNPNQRYPLLFRDYLRAHPRSAQSIALIKRQLAKHHGDDQDAYYDIKDPVYDLIWEAAGEWARGSGWNP